MAEQQAEERPAVAPEVEAEAKLLGWVPEEKFKGPPERWIDAETFVKRGHEVLPILKKNNQELVGKLTSQGAELAAVKTALAETTSGIQALKDFQAAEVKRQVESQVATLKAQLREARKGDDPDLVSDVEEALDEARSKQRELAAAPPPPPPPAPKPPGIEPWAQEFAAENAAWFPSDKRKSALFATFADEVYATGLRGKAMLDKAKEEMEAFLAPTTPPASKAEGGGRGGAGGDSGGPREKDYRDLPADAKAQCALDLKRMVGAGKPFKTEAEWRKHYVSVFFAS